MRAISSLGALIADFRCERMEVIRPERETDSEVPAPCCIKETFVQWFFSKCRIAVIIAMNGADYRIHTADSDRVIQIMDNIVFVYFALYF